MKLSIADSSAMLKRQYFLQLPVGVLFLYTILITNTRISNVEAFNMQKYELQFESPKIVSRCEKWPDNFIDSYVDYSQLEFNLLDNDVHHINGTIRLKKAMPSNTEVFAEVLKHSGGEWINTMYSIRRKDLCHTLFSPAEILYQFTKRIPLEKRVCPLPENYSLELDTDTADLIVEIPSNQEESEYKMVVTMYPENDVNNLICMEIIFILYRV